MRSLGGVDDSLKADLLGDYLEADIEQADKFMLAFADKLTREPASITREYVDGLRKAGFDDRSLHDIVQVTAYFNYVNRLADGLGVELEA